MLFLEALGKVGRFVVTSVLFEFLRALRFKNLEGMRNVGQGLNHT